MRKCFITLGPGIFSAKILRVKTYVISCLLYIRQASSEKVCTLIRMNLLSFLK